jgi:hypothetical protein
MHQEMVSPGEFNARKISTFLEFSNEIRETDIGTIASLARENHGSLAGNKAPVALLKIADRIGSCLPVTLTLLGSRSK